MRRKVHGGDRLQERRHSLKTYVPSPHPMVLIRTTAASQPALHEIAVPVGPYFPRDRLSIPSEYLPPDCTPRIFCLTCSVQTTSGPAGRDTPAITIDLACGSARSGQPMGGPQQPSRSCNADNISWSSDTFGEISVGQKTTKRAEIDEKVGS